MKLMNAKRLPWLVQSLWVSLLAASCDVESSSPSGGGGIDLPNGSEADAGADAGPGRSGDAATADGGDRDHGASAVRGFYVIHSDADSMSVSVLDARGRVLSDVLISSGSQNPGISTAFSGDVIPTSSALDGDEIVLIDRGNHVLSWVALETGDVTRQVHAGNMSFGANPYDYVEYRDKAFVTRFESNPTPGESDFDAGGDVLVLDRESGEPVGAIDLTSAYEEAPEAVLPRPTEALLAGDRLLVLTAGIDDGFATYAESRLVVIDPDEERVEQVFRFGGLRNCTSLALSPDRTRVAVGCAGPWGESEELESGVVVLDVTGELEPLRRVGAEAFLGARVGTVDFASAERLLVVTFGAYDDEGEVADPDRLWQLDWTDEDAEPSEVLAAPSPFVFSGLRCEPSASACLLADIETEGGVVRWLELDGDEIEQDRQLKIDDGIGLPPSYVGAF